ncbi:MAG: replicative DNA helicase [Alphaproteobacteria bacterium]
MSESESPIPPHLQDDAPPPVAEVTPLHPERQPKLPPHNLEAEQALLGALLMDNKAMENVGDVMSAECFYDPAHGRIYDAINIMIDRQQIANPVTLKAFFQKDDDLESVGGSEYLADLLESVITVVGARDYALTIRDLYMRRELIRLGDQLMQDANDVRLDNEAKTQIENAEALLFDLATRGEVGRGFVQLRESLKEAIDHITAAINRTTAVSGTTTGFTDMDKKLGGLHPSDLLILAGRPSMGKTTFAVNLAFRMAREHLETQGAEGAPVAVFSLEMSADQLAGRILSDAANIKSDDMRKGNLSQDDIPKFYEALKDLQDCKLFIDDTPGVSIGALRTKARRLKRQENIGLIVVDYLQLMSGSAATQGNRVQEISEITRGLKGIAKELGIPVLALSQLSRQVENREDKRPQLSDLRESGSIEQDADVVMFVYREQYYLERSEPMQKEGERDDDFAQRIAEWQVRCEAAFNRAKVIIAKQRHGPIGDVDLMFDGEYTRFDNLDDIHSPR